MSETEISIFDDLGDRYAIRRRQLLPTWIKFFCWFFAIAGNLGALVMITIALGGYSKSPVFLAFSGNSYWTLLVLFNVGHMLLKGATGIMLLGEKDLAVRFAIADGILSLGSAIVGFVNAYMHKTHEMVFATTILSLIIQLLFIIPYLAKMVRIRDEWEENKFISNPQTSDNQL